MLLLQIVRLGVHIGMPIMPLLQVVRLIVLLLHVVRPIVLKLPLVRLLVLLRSKPASSPHDSSAGLLSEVDCVLALKVSV